MKEVKLTRFLYGNDGTFGLVKAEKIVLYSLEMPWRNNKHNISCIPIGEYQCEATYSPAINRKCYIVKDVPDRAGIRIHVANYGGDERKGFRTDLKGCISLGSGMGLFKNQRILVGSAGAISMFEKELNFEPFKLIVNHLDVLKSTYEEKENAV